MSLSDTAIRNAKPKAKPYKLSDSGGLHLLVSPSGSRLWRLKYRFNGDEKSLSIGPYPAITLAQAREKREEAKAKAIKLRNFPSLEQIRTAIMAMPYTTVIERRDRALVAFIILTGMRDRAIASLSLRHVDMSASPPLVRQEPDRVKTKFSKNINTYFFPVGDDLRKIVSDWIDELCTVHLFAMNDPVFPRTRLAHDDNRSFAPAGIEPKHWSNASPIRTIFKKAFEQAGLPYFPPHSFRHTLGHLMQKVCRTPEQIKAWSQNLGHTNVSTTLTSYGTIDPYRQGDVMAEIALDLEEENHMAPCTSRRR